MVSLEILFLVKIIVPFIIMGFFLYNRKNKSTLKIATINYCGDSENRFEFWSKELNKFDNFSEACTKFKSITFDELVEHCVGYLA